MKKIQFIKMKIFYFLAYRNFFNQLDDKKYLKKLYKNTFFKDINFDKPETFNEKLQWLKLYDRKDIYTKMVDKYEVKKYVSNIIGDQYIIPTIGVYDSFDEINFNELPNQFVIKCTHDSGGLFIVKNKSNLNIKSARKKINKCLKRNFYYFGREWPYKSVVPRIIIEKYMVDESNTELKDYKIFCFNGKPELIMVDSGRFSKHIRNVYDLNWKKLDININFESDEKFIVKKPKQFNKLLELSEKLSKNIPFLRTDFYIVNDVIYFGELTFYPGSGLQKITPIKWQKKLGDLIDINLCKKIELGEK